MSPKTITRTNKDRREGGKRGRRRREGEEGLTTLARLVAFLIRSQQVRILLNLNNV
jgi:hypothetical protein